MPEIVIPELPELDFEERAHTYRLNGMVIPSVTTIMKPISDAEYKGISQQTLDVAASKGTSVHEAVENWVKFRVEDIQPEFKPYFDAFLDWVDKFKPVFIGSEVRMYHRLLGYAGTVDLLVLIDGKLTLIDVKSTYNVIEKACGLQLEAYAQALASHGIKVEQKMILHLTRDGKHREVWFAANDTERWRVFNSLKCVYDYINK